MTVISHRRNNAVTNDNPTDAPGEKSNVVVKTQKMASDNSRTVATSRANRLSIPEWAMM